MGIIGIVIVIATVVLIAIMASKHKIGTAKEKMLGLGGSFLKFVFFCLLFIIYCPFVMLGIYKIAPYNANILKNNLYFDVLQQKGDRYIAMSYYHLDDTAKDKAELVVALTHGRKVIRIDDSPANYSVTPSGQSGVRITFNRATDSFIYDVRDGEVYPIGMKSAQGGWIVFVSLLLSAVVAAVTPRIVTGAFMKIIGNRKLNS